MSEGKFQIIIMIICIALGALGHWAVATLDFSRARNTVVENNNDQDITGDISDISNSISDLSGNVENFIEEKKNTETNTPPPDRANPNATLIAELQKLITDKIYMRVGSKGTRVGTVQKFLNIFENKTLPVD